MVGIRAALSSNTMDISGGGGSLSASKSNNLTIQVNGDPGQQDVVSQPSGTVIVNCYKDATANPDNIKCNAIESESAVCIKVIQKAATPEEEVGATADDDDDREGKMKKLKRCSIKVNSAKKSRSTQCEDDHEDQLFAKDKSVKIGASGTSGSAKVDGNGDESQISDHTNIMNENDSISCSGLNHGNCSSSSTTTITHNEVHQIESDITKDNSNQMQTTSSSSRPKSFKSTEAQTDNNFLQQQQQQTNQTATEASSTPPTAMPIEAPLPTVAAPDTATTNSGQSVTGQTREERRRERRERRQHRALNQAGRHCHPNQRVGGGNGTVPPYEILPDLVGNQNTNNHHHLLPPPYSTLPLGSTMIGHPQPPPIVPRLPGPPGHHHHHHHHHMAQRLRSASPPLHPAPILMQAPPPVPILQPVPVASIANAVGEDPRFLFQLPVIRR